MKQGRPPKHGFSNHPIYQCWNDMMQRCYNSKRKAYKRYGGRGILVCSQWQEVGCFIRWASTNGWSPSLELDRKNNHGGYSPQNCQFVTPKRNSNNRRNNLIVRINGQEMTFAEAHERFGAVKYETARTRFKSRGWDLMDALRKPLDNRGYHTNDGIHRRLPRQV